MAFSNVARTNLGGGLAVISGDYTHTVGAADQTIAFDGDVLGGQIRPGVTVEPVDYRGDLFDTTVSGGITTVTVRGEAGVSAGRFWFLIRQGA